MSGHHLTHLSARQVWYPAYKIWSSVDFSPNGNMFVCSIRQVLSYWLWGLFLILYFSFLKYHNNWPSSLGVYNILRLDIFSFCLIIFIWPILVSRLKRVNTKYDFGTVYKITFGNYPFTCSKLRTYVCRSLRFCTGRINSTKAKYYYVNTTFNAPYSVLVKNKRSSYAQ